MKIKLNKRPLVGISTTWLEMMLSNYGSFWQHYALRLVLEKYGYSVFRLEARKTIEEFFYRPRWKYFFSCFLHYFHLRHYAQNVEAAMKNAWSIYWKNRRIYTKLIGKPVEDQTLISKCHAFVCGGDQIWTELKPILYLGTIDNSITKIAYACSADWKVCELSKEWKSFIKEKVQYFKGISIREKNGCKILQEILPNKKIFHALDPVALLKQEDYKKIIPTKLFFIRPTLFCYFLNIRSAEHFPLKELEIIAQKLNCELRILGIQGAAAYIPEQYRITVSHIQFLQCIRDASYIITNSFHGTVFSLLFHKQFVTIGQINLQGSEQNTRFTELLYDLNLQSHLLNLQTLTNIYTELLDTIYWDKIDAIIANRRIQSLSWLQTMLKEE